MSAREEALKRARQRLAAPPQEIQLTGLIGQRSDLPTPNPEELYSSYVPSGDSSVRGEPFGREFDFTGTDPLPKGFQPDQFGTIAERSKRFIDRYFGGQDSAVVNPATGVEYGNELKIHDAFHEYANVNQRLLGEEFITAGESAATRSLQGSGLIGLTQQDWDPGAVEDPDRSARRGALAAHDNARRGRPLVQTGGRGSSLFRDRNSPASFLSPPLSPGQVDEIIRRGREFYDQVHAGWGEYLNDWHGLTTQEARGVQDPIRRGRGTALSDHFIQDVAPNIMITGGYKDRGGMPFGPKEQLMNPPLVPVVDYEPWNQSLGRQIAREAEYINRRAMQELEAYNSIEEIQKRAAQEAWNERASNLRSTFINDGQIDFDQKGAEELQEQYNRLKQVLDQSPNKVFGNNNERLYMPEELKEAIPRVIGPMPEVPELGNTARFVGDRVERDYGGRSLGHIEQYVRRELIDDSFRRIGQGGVKAGLADSGGKLYLNPPNLGSGDYMDGPPWTYPISRGSAQNMLLTAAADAKDFGRVRKAIGTGFNAATDVAGSVPLFDPAFRRAVEDNNLPEAAKIAAKEYAIGAVAAPVTGAATGVLQRVAPATAASVLPAVARVARVGSPVAVVSQLGGSSRETARQRVLQRQQDPQSVGAKGPSATPQLLKAEQARRRGGRWKIGPFTVPELGLSEAGGLFFR